MDAMGQAPKLVTVFGGSGFVGRHVVRALAKRGWRVRVAVRRPNLGVSLQPMGVVGQIQLVQANLRYPDSVAAAARGADAVVNLVGILGESGRQTFAEVQAGGARAVAAATAPGTPLVHVSALGAYLRSPALYARTKAQGEAAILQAHPGAVVLRPSVVFGPGDGFFNRFASLARLFPALPITGADTRFQPVFVGDVAEAAARAVEGRVAGGAVYELGGPEVLTLRQIVDYVLEVTERRRLVLPLPFGLGLMQARALEIADTLALGLLPANLKLTRDQVELLRTDNVVSEAARAEGRTLDAFGIAPETIGAVVPAYLTRFRKTGQFDIARVA